MKKPVEPRCRPKGAINRARWRSYYEARTKYVEWLAKQRGVPVSRLIAERLTAAE